VSSRTPTPGLLFSPAIKKLRPARPPFLMLNRLRGGRFAFDRGPRSRGAEFHGRRHGKGVELVLPEVPGVVQAAAPPGPARTASAEGKGRGIAAVDRRSQKRSGLAGVADVRGQGRKPKKGCGRGDDGLKLRLSKNGGKEKSFSSGENGRDRLQAGAGGCGWCRFRRPISCRRG